MYYTPGGLKTFVGVKYSDKVDPAASGGLKVCGSNGEGRGGVVSRQMEEEIWQRMSGEGEGSGGKDERREWRTQERGERREGKDSMGYEGWG